MTHVREELTALLDDALPPAERDRVLGHLAGCGPCRAERDRMASALAALRGLPPAPEPSAGFEQRFFARLARERAAPPRSLLARLPWRFLAPLAAAGAAAALMVGIGLRDRHRQQFIAGHLDLLESYEAVASVGDVAEEDIEVVAELHELEGAP